MSCFKAIHLKMQKSKKNDLSINLDTKKKRKTNKAEVNSEEKYQ